VILSGHLERPLHFTDIVLQTTLHWSTWEAEDARDAYLVIKRNSMYASLSPYLSPLYLSPSPSSSSHYSHSHSTITMFSEFKFADKHWNKFKKVLIEFIGAKLACYKDAKAEKSIGQWNIEDITWFLGAEKKRCAPSKWCITFVERDKPVRR
jgi:hypothetical protein